MINTKRYFLTVAIAILYSVTSFAQPVAQVGPDNDLKEHHLSDVFFKDETGYYLMVRTYVPYSRPYIKHITNDLKCDQESGLLDEKLGEHETPYYGFGFNGKPYLLVGKIEDRKNKFMVYELNTATLEPDGDPVPLATINSVPPEKKGKRDVREEREELLMMNDISLDHSPDGSKLLVTNHTMLADGKVVYEEHVFDKELNLVWEKQVVPAFAARGDRCLFSEKIDNDGNVYTLEYELTGTRMFQNTTLPTIARKVHLTICSENGTKVISRVLDDGGKQLLDCQLNISGSAATICGFYSSGDWWTAEGVYFESFDRVSGNTITKKETPLAADFLAKLNARPGKKEKMQLEVNTVCMAANGDFVLVAEANFYEEYSKVPGPIKDYIIYNNTLTADILVIGLSKSGDIRWQTDIVKSQWSVLPITGIFVYTAQNGDVKILYNDNEKNLSTAPGAVTAERFDNGKNAVAVLLTVDPSGKVIKEKLFTAPHKEEPVCIPTVSIFGNELVMAAATLNDKQFNMVRIGL